MLSVAGPNRVSVPAQQPSTSLRDLAWVGSEQSVSDRCLYDRVEESVRLRCGSIALDEWRYVMAMARLSRFRLRRAAARLAWLALGGIIAAVAVWFLIGAVRGDTSGTVSDKQLVNGTSCNGSHRLCTTKPCFQITYVTDDGDHKLTCLTQEEYDKIQVGDHYAG